MIKLFMVKNIIFATFNLKDTLNYSLINLTAMRKTLLLSLFVLFSAMVGWAQDSGKDLGLKLLKSTEITDGMQLAFQSVSTTNPLNWFQGAVAAGDFGESVIFVAEATGETAADGKALYVLRQKSAEESVAYLQMPAANNSDVTMGARETAAEITFNPYNEHEHADNAKLEGEFSEEYSTRVTLQFDASTQTFLNCNSAGTIVHWGTGFGSWSYWNIYEIPADFRLVPVTYNITFFDGSTDVTLEEAGLSDLIPSAVVEGEGSVTAEAIVGGKVAFPTFSNTTLRRALKTDGTVLSEEETFVLSEDLLEGDALTLNLEYSSDPRILFECSIDASMFGPEDDPSLFVFDETGTAEMEKSVRVAVGEAITAPAISHFTALTAIEEEATQSKTISVSYRPWRRIYVDGYVLKEGYHELWRQGKTHPVPYLIGCNREDMLSDPQALARGEQGGMYHAMEDFARQACPNTPVYAYYFTRQMPGDNSGAFHSAELWYVFGTMDRAWRPWTPEDHRLCDQILSYWTRFMKTGNPNEDDQENWPAYTLESPHIQILDVKSGT